MGISSIYIFDFSFVNIFDLGGWRILHDRKKVEACRVRNLGTLGDRVLYFICTLRVSFVYLQARTMVALEDQNLLALLHL